MKGMDIVAEVGPPDRKAKKRPMDDEDAMDGGADDDMEDDAGNDEAAKVSAMAEFQDAVKNGTAKEALAAWDQFYNTCG